MVINKNILRISLIYFPFFIFICVTSVWLMKTAYEHRGFFVYHFNLLTSKTYSSYQEELLELVKQNPKHALIKYREILEKDPLSYNTCHGIAHQMGHTAFETFGFQKAMASQDGICGAGYIHGIIEAKFGLLREKEIIDVLPTICDEGNTNCYHGIGHGLMVATKFNIRKSLLFCDQLPESGNSNCYDGVWMHIFDIEESGAPHEFKNTSALPSAVITKQRASLCFVADKPYKTSCYFYLPRIYAHAEEATFSDYLNLCNDVEQSYKSVCATGVGHTSMKYHIADPQASIDQCNNFKNEDMISSCKEGSFLYYLFSTEEKDDSAYPCNQFTSKEENTLCKKVEKYRRK